MPRVQGPKTVYLAGGHRNPWRQRVVAEVTAFRYRDPSAHGIKEARAYTAWDLEAVKSSDILFAYFEAGNPSGYGLALEVGYAAALGKHIIFVDEKSEAEPSVGRYLNIVKETSDVHFKTLEEGIDYLRRLASLV
jgi:nucleoside 2-deoxyribosyltransferase